MIQCMEINIYIIFDNDLYNCQISVLLCKCCVNVFSLRLFFYGHRKVTEATVLQLATQISALYC